MNKLYTLQAYQHNGRPYKIRRSDSFLYLFNIALKLHNAYTEDWYINFSDGRSVISCDNYLKHIKL